jgi:hypothetical protein
MKVTISGYGGASVAAHEIEWPFTFPPTEKMTVQWEDQAKNERRGTIDTVTYNLTKGSIAVTVAIR